MQDKWRFISYNEHRAAFNMAVDEAILEAHIKGMSPPTLRLYGFSPAAVSIGHHQKVNQETKDRIAKLGYDLVVRPTGGRAVLHLNDLTYSFVGTEYRKENDQEFGFLSSSVNEAYKQISQGLQNGLAMLKVNSELGISSSAYRDKDDCFAATTRSDLHINGLKLAGSAQLRRKGAVLQHGSILLNQSQTAMSEIFEDSVAQTKQRHANLFDLLPDKVSQAELESIFKKGFEQAFNIELIDGELTAFEHDCAREVLQSVSCAI